MTTHISNDDPRSRARARRVLVVDDNREAADALASLLRFMGYEVKAAYGGVQGLDAAHTFAPEVAIWDLSMPQVDGYEAARRLRDHAPGRSILLVALSGRTSEADRAAAMAAGFDVHLPKPMDVAALLEVLGCA